jgi:hypothetical protein
MVLTFFTPSPPTILRYISKSNTYQPTLTLQYTSTMTTDPNELTARESEVLALAWQCMDTDPKVCFFSTMRILSMH